MDEGEEKGEERLPRIMTLLHRLRHLRMRRLLLVLLVLMTSLQLVTWLLGMPRQYVTSLGGDYLQVFPQRQWSGRQKPLVLLWTPYYNHELWWPGDVHAFDQCPQPECQLTSDKARVGESDAVLFHAWDLWHFFLGRALPAVRLPHQVWVLMSREPGSEQPLDLSRYNGVFNWTAWYRPDADVTLPYAHVVPLAERGEQGKELSGRDWSAGKTKMAAWVASNCYDSARRRRVVRELSRYIPVDTYGACGTKTVPCPGYQADCPEVLSAYKFYLAFENSLCPGYVTEKFWRALLRNQVPITLGGINYTGVVPPGSYISLDDFASVKELAAHLRYLDNNDAAYNSYFRWREQWRVDMADKGACLICAALHDRGRPAQVYTDLAAWNRRVESPGCETFSIPNYLSRFKDGVLISLGLK